MGNVVLIGICMSFTTVGNAIFNASYFWSGEFLHWFFGMIAFSLATMSMNMNLSFLIKNPKIAADISGIYIFAIILM